MIKELKVIKSGSVLFMVQDDFCVFHDPFFTTF